LPIRSSDSAADAESKYASVKYTVFGRPSKSKFGTYLWTTTNEYSVLAMYRKKGMRIIH